MWETLIRATGGAIEPVKSFWVGINPSIDSIGNTVLRKCPQQQEIVLRGLDGKTELLQQKSHEEAYEGLGVWQAPNGQEETQTSKLIKKIELWDAQVKQFPAKKYEAKMMLEMMMMMPRELRSKNPQKKNFLILS